LSKIRVSPEKGKLKINDNRPDRDNDIDFKLWRILNHTGFVIARSRKKELAQYGLTQEQAHVLDILHHSSGTVTIQEIVNITMRQHHSISTLVDRMAKQGLVKKARSASDARQYDVIMTEKGQELFGRTTRDSIADIFSALSASEKRELYRGLKKLRARAYKLLGKKYQPNVLPD
jgi:DNA-binding MarR family transcriptional regulator